MAEYKGQDRMESPYLKFNLRMVRMMGIWNDHGVIFRVNFFTMYMYLIYLGILVGTVLQVYTTSTDIPIITESVSAFMSYGVNCLKLTYLIIYEKEFKHLLSIISSNFSNELQASNPEHHKILLKRDKESKMLTILFGSCVCTCVTFLNIQPLGEVLLHDGGVNGTSEATWRFPWRFVMPFDTSTSIVYWLVYAFHCTLGWFHVLVMPGCDNFYIALINHVYGQCIILRDNLEHLYEITEERIYGKEDLKYNSVYVNTPAVVLVPSQLATERELLESNILIVSKGNGYSRTRSLMRTDAKFEEEIKRRLKNCVIHHKSILRFVNQLEWLMNKLMLSQFFTSIIVFCTVTFQVIMFPADRMKLIGMSGFLTGEAVQLFMYCYFADKIREETDLIATSAYFSRWPDMSKSMKNLLMIIMARSQKATKFTVGKFTELSLDTFANILKASYTYLMMLIEMDER